jgi:hypothetical protein
MLMHTINTARARLLQARIDHLSNRAARLHPSLHALQLAKLRIDVRYAQLQLAKIQGAPA